MLGSGNMSQNEARILPPVILIIIGLVPWYYASQAWMESISLVDNTIAVQGIVVDYESSYETASRTSPALFHYPIVEFIDRNGSTQRLTSGVGAGKRLYDIGESVRVRYDPRDRRQPVVDSFLRLWAKPALFAFAGLPFVLLGGFRFFRAIFGRSD